MSKLNIIFKTLKLNKIKRILKLPKSITKEIIKTLYILNKGDKTKVLHNILYLDFCYKIKELDSQTVIKEFYKEKLFKSITVLLQDEKLIEVFENSIKNK